MLLFNVCGFILNHLLVKTSNFIKIACTAICVMTLLNLTNVDPHLLSVRFDLHQTACCLQVTGVCEQSIICDTFFKYVR